MANERLLIEDWGGSLTFELNEAANGLLVFTGKFSEAEVPNKNKRIYSRAILDENVQRLTDVVKARGLVGELDHPSDSIIHFKEASHVITKLWWENNILKGSGECLSTAHGRQLKALLNDGVRVGISSRGVGNGKVNENGILVISESYKLITFDCVADPSCSEAFQEKGKREHTMAQNNLNSDEKNLDSGIYKITKEAVIAAFGGIVKEQTYKIKRGLGNG